MAIHGFKARMAITESCYYSGRQQIPVFDMMLFSLPNVRGRAGTVPVGEHSRHSFSWHKETTVVISAYEHWSKGIARNYGRKTGWARTLFFQGIGRVGAFSRYRNVDWARVNRLVFVCKGNICRSPYAEAKARALGLPAESFGLESDGRSDAYPSAVRASAKRGIDLSQHRSHRMAHIHMDPGVVLIGMEPWHAANLQAVAQTNRAQVTLLGLWAEPPRPHLEDPYGLGDAYFDTCFSLIDVALDRISLLLPRKVTDRNEAGSPG